MTHLNFKDDDTYLLLNAHIGIPTLNFFGENGILYQFLSVSTALTDENWLKMTGPISINFWNLSQFSDYATGSCK